MRISPSCLQHISSGFRILIFDTLRWLALSFDYYGYFYFFLFLLYFSCHADFDWLWLPTLRLISRRFEASFSRFHDDYYAIIRRAFDDAYLRERYWLAELRATGAGLIANAERDSSLLSFRFSLRHGVVFSIFTERQKPRCQYSLLPLRYAARAWVDMRPFTDMMRARHVERGLFRFRLLRCHFEEAITLPRCCASHYYAPLLAITSAFAALSPVDAYSLSPRRLRRWLYTICFAASMTLAAAHYARRLRASRLWVWALIISLRFTSWYTGITIT